MTNLSAIVGIGLCLLTQAIEAAPVDTKKADFGIGGAVGVCLVVKCEVLRGFITTDSPKSGDLVTIRIEEVLFGTQDRRETVQLPYEDYDHARNGDGGAWLARAWEKVKPLRNVPVTVVVGLESGFLFRAGEPVFVTSDEHETTVIRTVTREATRLEKSPDLVFDDVAALSENPDPSLAGYLFTYLTLGRTRLSTDQISELVVQFLESPSVPAQESRSIGDFLVFRYHALSAAGKSRLIRRFAELAQHSDPALVESSYKGLTKIAAFDHSIPAMLPQELTVSLEAAYRNGVKMGRLPRDKAFEGSFGIRIP